MCDLGALVKQQPELAGLCVASEFANRDDGLPGLEKAYGFELPEQAVMTLEQEDLIYDAVDNGDPCTFGEAFRTDVRIDSLDLRLLEDDKRFFPVYNPALTVRAQLLDEHPEIEDLFAPGCRRARRGDVAAAQHGRRRRRAPVQDLARDFLEDEEILSPQQLTK